METATTDFTELYRGFEIQEQAFALADDMADVRCRVFNPADPDLAPLTADMQQVPGGPFEAMNARDVGLYYRMGLVDDYLDKPRD